MAILIINYVYAVKDSKVVKKKAVIKAGESV